MKTAINKIFSYLYIFLFVMIFPLAAFSAVLRLSNAGISPGYFAAAFLMILASCAALFTLVKTYSRRLSGISVNAVFAASIIIMTIIEIVLAFKLRYVPVHDSLYVDTAARSFAYSGNFQEMYTGIKNKTNYFSRFPNNWAILIFLSYVYRIVFLVTGRIPYMTAPLMNIAFVQLSAVVTFLTAKLIFKDKPRQIFCAIFFAVTPAFYLYSQIFYTDTFSMPFVISAVYCFIRSVKADSRRAAVLWTLGSSLLTGIGYSIKGSVAVILIALIIYGFLKKPLFGAVSSAAIMTAALLVINTAVFYLGLSLGISNEKKLDRYRIPTAHWVMMGLVGNGGFNQEEYDYTKSFHSYEEKKAAANKRISEHISDYTPRGFIDHITEKINYTWDSGKYFAIHHLSGSKKRDLFNFLKGSGLFTLYCDSIQAVMIFLMLSSFIGDSSKKRITPMFLLRTAVFGLALFLLIWETRSRYLVNFLPLFMLLSADGMRYFCVQIYSLRAKFPVLSRHNLRSVRI